MLEILINFRVTASTGQVVAQCIGPERGRRAASGYSLGELKLINHALANTLRHLRSIHPGCSVRVWMAHADGQTVVCWVEPQVN